MSNTPIQFELNGVEFFKAIGKIRYVKAEKLLILIHKHRFYAGFQEPEAIAWVCFGRTKRHKFKTISVDCNNFLSICKHQQQMSFRGDSKLDAETIGANFKVKNIPLENWQPNIDYLQFKAKPIDGQYKKFLDVIRGTMKMALELDSTVKVVQIMRYKDQIIIASLVATGSLGFIATWELNSGWRKFFDELKIKTWLIPVEAATAFLDDTATVLRSKGDKIIVYSENYHIIFNQYGESKPTETFVGLLNREPVVRLDLDYNAMHDLLAKLPVGKTIELKIINEKKLAIESTGYAKISVELKVQQQLGKDQEIVLNHKQFRQLVGAAHMFKGGTLQWGNFAQINCELGRFKYRWLLGKSYDSAND